MTHTVEHLGGLAVALVTPFDDDGALDVPAFERQVERMIEGGVSVLMPCGTTGESATLTPAEQREVITACVRTSGGRVPVYAGAGTNDTRQAVALARGVREAGADGILSVTPYYNKPGPEGLYRHYRAVCEAAELPVVLYNVPGRTGVNMSAETVLRLAELEEVVGIKEASGDVEQLAAILARRPEGFRVLAGDDAFALPVVALGGDGVVSVAANQVPGLMNEMVTAALEGRWERAREIHYRLLPLMRANFVEANPVPVKTSLELLGLMGARVRLPLAPLSEASRETVRRALDTAGVEEA